MKCKHVQQHLIDYLEELLDSKTQHAVEDHLRHCSECQHELKEMEQTLHMLQELPCQEPPENFWPDFTSSVMRQVRHLEVQSTPQRFFGFMFMPPRVALAVVSLFCVLGGAFFYLAGFFQDNPQTLEGIVQHIIEEDNVTSSPLQASEKGLNSMLERIASEEVVEDILSSEFTLFEGNSFSVSDAESRYEWLYFLLENLSDEEKDRLLLELYKMK